MKSNTKGSRLLPARYPTLQGYQNGIALTLNFMPAGYSLGDLWLDMPEIKDIILQSLGYSGECVVSIDYPSQQQIQNALDQSSPLIVICVGQNHGKGSAKIHLHAWIYHPDNPICTKDFACLIEQSLRQMPVVAPKANSALFLQDCTTPIQPDAQWLYRYIRVKNGPSLLNYYLNSNSGNFIYIYDPSVPQE